MIRVLHVFSREFGYTFSGHNQRWIRGINNWQHSEVKPLVFCPQSFCLLEPIELANANVKHSRQLSRIAWSFCVLQGLIVFRNEYDIVHVHTWDWGGLLTPLIAKFVGKLSICELSQFGNDNPSVLAQQSLGRFKIRLFRLFDRALCISDALKNDALHFGVSAKTILNPVDLTKFSFTSGQTKFHIRREMGLPITQNIILFVGSVIYRKGIDVLIDAIAKLASCESVELVIVGPRNSEENSGVDDQFVQRIENQISHYGLSDRVLFTGRIDNDKLLSMYYDAADIMVFPSRNEGLGNVMLEAMASGLPTVASQLDGITDLVIDDGTNGFLVPVEDSDAIAERVQLLIRDADLRLTLGQNARKYVVEKHSFAAWEAQVARLYSELLK